MQENKENNEKFLEKANKTDTPLKESDVVYIGQDESKLQEEISESVLKDDQIDLKKKRQLTYKLDNYFKIKQRGSSIKQEFFAGFVNFLVLSYILVVIPGLFSGIGGQDLWKAIFLATILTTIIATASTAFYANIPIVLAPGIGLVSFTVQLVENGTYTFEQAMAICFLAGLTFLVITITGLRKKIIKAIPNCIKLALPAGVGLFILNIGLNSSNSGIIDAMNGTAQSFAPVVAIVSFIIMCVLYAKKIKGSIFIGIASGTLLDIIIKLITGVEVFTSFKTASWLPPFRELINTSLFKFDFAGLFQGNIVNAILSVCLTIFAVVLIDMFDTVGTLYATASKGNLIDNKGEVIGMDRCMLVDGCSAMLSSCVGIPNATSYVESSTGIASGARTGLSTLFTSLFFLVSMFLSPIIQLIPVYATAPALVLVGILMFDSVLKIDFKDLATAIPAVLTIVLMPLTSNITYGIAGGMISYTLIMLLSKRVKEINVLTYVISALFILYFVVQYI